MDQPSQVDVLDATMSGVWLVRSRSSSHVWDLDAGTYERLPDPGSSQFAYDGATLTISRVDRWPAVGDQSVVCFDDPDHPHLIEHLRVSSPIRRITRLRPEDLDS